jgi:mannan endo-1,4-beta-mannosidase
MLKRIIKKSAYLFLFLISLLQSQTTEFVSVNNGKFYLHNERFYPLGTNAYYLHRYACANDTNSIQEFFKAMNELGMNTLRSWAFCDGDDPADIYTLQYKPYTYNEKSFERLDYIIKTAANYNIKIIFTFVNNWNDLGGMNQYLKWYSQNNKLSGSFELNNRIYSQSSAANYYESKINASVTHDDFYKLDTIKAWYKAYLKNILNRKNIYSGVEYKNDTSIMAFELANEPESSDKTGQLIYNWIKEMSEYFKKIDQNHLLSTGEFGYDVEPNGYGNYSKWLLDGQKGISFKLNSSIESIDYTTAHLYSEIWNNTGGAEWIYDHNNISILLGKPFLIGEYGSKVSRKVNFTSWLRAINETGAGGALLWQLTPANFKADDGYVLKLSPDYDDCYNIKNLYNEIRSGIQYISKKSFFSNVFPNPANREIYVRFTLEAPGEVKYYLYNVLGEQIIKQTREFYKGNNAIMVNLIGLPSGIYFLRLENSTVTEIKKIAVVK